MTKPALTAQQHFALIKHLASGKDPESVALIFKLTAFEVIEIAKNHGYPDSEKLQWAADILEKNLASGEQLPERPMAGGTVVSTARPPQTPIMPSTLAPPVRPDEIRILINTAKAHPSKRIQAAGDRVIDGVNKLKELIAEDQEKNAEKRAAAEAKAAAQAEVKRLEAQLAAAKAKLRGNPAAVKKVAPAPSTTDEPTAAEIRTWARDNNVECPKAGRIPGDVREAYDDAHIQVAS